VRRQRTHPAPNQPIAGSPRKAASSLCRMRLVPKLALTLLAGVFSVLAVFTIWRVRGEIVTYDHDVRRDHRMIGLTAAAAVSKTRMREDAMRLVHRIDASRERIGIRFVSLAPSSDPRVAPSVQLAPEEVPAPGAWIQLERRLPQENASAEYLLTYVGAPVVDDPHGAIQLEESLEPRAAYVSRGVWSALASSVAMMFVCAVIVASAGVRLVGKPVSELLAAVRQIGAGHFDVLGTAVRRADEFGELARALRAMSLELEATRLRMEKEVEARIATLQQLRHAERLTTLGHLASVLAHEIGTPLNVIGGHAKMVATGRLVGEHARESGVVIGSQCERMAQIVQRILDYARRRPPRRISIDAADVMRQAHGMLSGLAEQRHVELILDGNGDRTALLADPDQLQQAVINLVMNAIQASEPGATVRLGVATETRKDDSETNTEYVVLLVQDYGTGMSEDTLSRIFEPFFTTKPPGQGTGLGLSVVREIAREHGGFVELQSREHQGSTFRLCLPIGAADARPYTSH
jgi:two-component system, NtrC family, sensor kinase